MKTLKIADFFAGIGGIRLAFDRQGCEAVFSNEIDDFACKTYVANFGNNPKGDITKLDAKEIPDHDILLAGFPCQAFSIAGAKMGFEDTRGTLFFDVARVLKEKKPKAFLLENVKNLLSHDKGRTFKVIKNTLERDLGYTIFYRVLNARNFGVPQNRERILIVGFRKDLGIHGFDFPIKDGKAKTLSDILERDVPLNYFISKVRFKGMQNHKKKHMEKGHGFGYRILDPDGISGAIVVGGMGRERNLVMDKDSFSKLKGKRGIGKKTARAIRYLTPREYARLQGFPDNFAIPVSNAQAYKQFANSVAVPMIGEVAVNMIKVLEDPKKHGKKGQYELVEYASI